MICTKHGNVKRYKNGKCCRCAVEAVARRRLKVKRLALDYKGNACVCCGYDKCDAALEFHHTDPAKKDFDFSTAYKRAWSRIKEELDKCMLVCSNCHREIHAMDR